MKNDIDIGVDYTLSVASLQRALAQLKPTDRVTVNRVANLLVFRDKISIGFINVRSHYDDSDAWEPWEAK